MLEKINLKTEIDKKAYKKTRDRMIPQLSALQRQVKSLGIPVMIIFEGWDAAGKGTLINELTVPLDPRSIIVHNSKHKLSDEEVNRPYLWRYWTKIPKKGQIVIWDESYYNLLAKQKQEGPGDRVLFQEANEFEKILADSGVVIIKFFIHISKKEQKRRFEELENNKATSWRVTKGDWAENKHYDTTLKRMDNLLEMTDNESAHWTVVEGTDNKFACVKVFDTVYRALSDAVARVGKAPAADHQPLIKAGDDPYRTPVLEGIDMDVAMDKAAYKEELAVCQEKLRLLEYEIYKRRIPVVIGFEGWDAGGKGGAIKRLCQNLDPRGYQVHPTAAPTQEDLDHNWLWRFWANIPKRGHIAIFDRTWYGRVMVEPIEGFCTAEEYNRAFSEINSFEKQLTDYGAVVLKFWMNITKDEQEKRFKEREQNPDKQWKITDEDWRNREKWDQYLIAVDRMLVRTSTEKSPWIVVEGNNKYYARIRVLKAVIAAIEEGIKEKKGEK